MTHGAYLIDLECDWGEDTALWAGGYPIDSRSIPFSQALLDDLLEWTSRFVMNKTEQGGYVWAADFDVLSFDKDGESLASRTAVELGPKFSITYVNTLGEKIQRRASTKASNPAAEAILEQWMIDLGLTD